MRSERIFEAWNAWTRVRAAITALFDAFERQFGLFRIHHRFRSTMRNDRRRDSTADDVRAAKIVRVFNLGGVLGLEATNRVARALRERLSRCFKVVVVADAKDVDVFDDGNDDDDGNNDFIVFVVETAERDEPASEARDRVKSILKRASAAKSKKSKSSRLYGLLGVGDCDIIPDRAAFRSNQSVARDCNAVAVVVDEALRVRLGWMRAGEATLVDVSKESEWGSAGDETTPAIRAWADGVAASLDEAKL
jgi:hypothetical protein